MMRTLTRIMVVITAALFIVLCFRVPAPWGGIWGVILILVMRRAIGAILPQNE